MMLKPAFREKAVKAPEHWHQVAHGAWLKAEVEQVLAPHIERLYGYHLAKVGCLTAELELPRNAIRHHMTVGDCQQNPIQVRALPTAWPFAEAALDAIVMVNQLEFEQDPHQVLREMSRSLIADGKLILVGFNPLALNQVQRLWPKKVNQFPWCGRYFSKMRILDWLSLLNMEVTTQHYFAASMLQQRWPFLETGVTKLARWIPQVSALYVIVATKREFPLTPVSERVKTQKVRPKLQTVPLANQTRR
ncbi:class I SAM-dependent methyltransferase [Pseudidiomarina salilacus]|uniref:class I SAM-dependent methyltransferase n=1 Tax=Pseudidiomarina salilacus TaxID=3384452 RepID=UPI003984C321